MVANHLTVSKCKVREASSECLVPPSTASSAHCAGSNARVPSQVSSMTGLSTLARAHV